MAQDDLLKYYNQELDFIRELGNEFAHAHPKIAGNLKLGKNSIEDPHVARLVEAFALLNAKIRHRLDDDLPELRDALLNNIYPHYIEPIPSMNVVQFKPGLGALMNQLQFDKNTVLKSQLNGQQDCQFMTCYPLTLWPIELKEAKLTGRPLQSPDLPNGLNAKSTLKMTFSALNGTSFADFNLDKLRFYINAPLQQAYACYELLMRHTVAIAICNADNDYEPQFLDIKSLKPVGFSKEDGLLPYEDRTFMGYRLLTEFFTMPQKFLFVDLYLNQLEKLKQCTKGMEIYFYFDQHPIVLEHKINPSYFALGCTPIVNLFKDKAAPFHHDDAKSEYHLVTHEKQALNETEIYRVLKVVGIDSVTGETTDYHPFYGLTHHNDSEIKAYYQCNRRPSWYANQYIQGGNEVFISFTNTNREGLAASAIMNVDLLCTNRDLPHQLSYDEASFQIVLDEHHTAIETIACLQSFTPSYRPAFTDKLGWQLISHFSLNHLSLTDDAQGLLALQEILKLYDYSKNDSNLNLREGLLSLKCKQATARNPTRHGNTFLQGQAVTLEVDERNFSGSSLYLFSKVLDHFLALYCNINSFTELTVKARHSGSVYHFAPRVGDKQII